MRTLNFFFLQTDDVFQSFRFRFSKTRISTPTLIRKKKSDDILKYHVHFLPTLLLLFLFVQNSLTIGLNKKILNNNRLSCALLFYYYNQ